MPVTFNTQLRDEYQHLFNSCTIRSEKMDDVNECVSRIVAGRNQYEAVASRTNIPWYFIGIIHNMECSCRFNTHLHNGDPLTKKTTHVPKGFPKNGLPPFTWVDSAEDALKLKSLHTWTDWTVPGLLFQFERYNGFGYRPRGINSPYLWSFSNHYSRGKFTSDGIFDSNAISKQIGAAVLLRRMSELQLAVTGETDIVTQIKNLGEKVKYDPDHFNELADQLQQLLNGIGQHLKVDGKAGKNTSDAYKRISGKFLKGDPRS